MKFRAWVFQQASGVQDFPVNMGTVLYAYTHTHTFLGKTSVAFLRFSSVSVTSELEESLVSRAPQVMWGTASPGAAASHVPGYLGRPHQASRFFCLGVNWDKLANITEAQSHLMGCPKVQSWNCTPSPCFISLSTLCGFSGF